MHQGIAYFERRRLNVAGAVYPIIVSGGRRGSTDMDVDVGTVGVIDQPMIDDMGTLL